ncbi:N-acetylglucosamine-6-phosphate deacetylase [Salinarimonas ramus]|uniref:N-acetylglucosamine-6-phosphate deacetylase n=1 Tax=Salinarimonas ramus TaxID=690164 RepID=A0A917Q3V2_9HYPH|nr:N-acetylglucosamine-6-phosphate deacetylase [Salinarimonas ramus]GGK17635.1 N-acetylglucosamine-6-phosphate deacetylase [Salinarimonas ramus]
MSAPETARSGPDRWAVRASRLFDGDAFHEAAAVVIEAGRVLAVVPEADVAAMPGTHLPEDALLAPGFVDLQVNGGGGVLLNDAPTPEGAVAIVTAHRAHGSTGLMLTLISDGPSVLDALVEAAADIAAVRGVAGFHVEGPFLAPERRGVHRLDVLRIPDEADFRRLARLAAVAPTILTLAPERVPAGTIRRFAESGVRVFIGHSQADAACVARAVEEGAIGATHLFNAMSQIGPREPGIVGAVLDDARLCAGIIADGLHVHEANLRLAYRVLGPRRLALVTDAMPSVGSEEGGFVLQGRAIALEGGRLTARDGTLAGAHLGMDEVVRNAVNMMGASLGDALAMASAVPARIVGLAGRGRLVKGARADLVALDADLRTIATWIDGEPAQPPRKIE